MTGRPVEVSCNLCGGNFTDLLHIIDGIRVVQCRVCNLVYLNPRDEDAVAARNRSRDLVSHFAPMARRQRVVAERRLADLERLVGRPGRLLDVGCAAGLFMDAARGRGWSVAGVDVNGPATAFGRGSLGLEVVTGTLGDLPDSLRPFDAVTLWDVLEHVTDPMGTVALARDRMSGGGILALSVPNVESLAAWVGKERWPMFGDEHLTYFTAETIRKTVALSGFEVLKVTTHGLGRTFLTSLRGASGVASRIEASYAEASHRPWVLRGERMIDALLDVAKAGQVITLYARKVNRRESPPPQTTKGPVFLRRRRRKGMSF